MANYILKQGDEILRCSNWAMEVLYDNLKNIIHLEKLHDNKNLADFLERLDQNVYGRGCIYIDIITFFNHDSKKMPPELLYQLIEKTIKVIKKKNEFEGNFINILESFKNKIL